MKTSVVRPLLLVAATAAMVAALAPLAAADGVYHTEHLALAPIGGAPLRSGFVQNIKANGPQVYAHELYVLNGAAPGTTYTVTRNFFVFDRRCEGMGLVSRVGTIVTNAAGNGRGDAVMRPEDIPGFLVDLERPHGVIWTVADATGTIRYETTCTAVTLD